MMEIIQKHQEEFNQAVKFLREDIKSIRSNRIGADLVENILIDSYGAKTPLKSLAGISSPEPRTLVIEVWDRNIIKQVEEALSSADLGSVPQAQGTLIRIKMPPLSQEQREKLVKVLHNKLENARNSLRTVRDKVKKEITDAEYDKEITEDDKYRLVEELNKLTAEKQEEIDKLGEKKEEEITTV